MIPIVLRLKAFVELTTHFPSVTLVKLDVLLKVPIKMAKPTAASHCRTSRTVAPGVKRPSKPIVSDRLAQFQQESLATWWAWEFPSGGESRAVSQLTVSSGGESSDARNIG